MNVIDQSVPMSGAMTTAQQQEMSMLRTFVELACVTRSRVCSVSAARREEAQRSRRRSVWQEAESVLTMDPVIVESAVQTVIQVGV